MPAKERWGPWPQREGGGLSRPCHQHGGGGISGLWALPRLLQGGGISGRWALPQLLQGRAALSPPSLPCTRHGGGASAWHCEIPSAVLGGVESLNGDGHTCPCCHRGLLSAARLSGEGQYLSSSLHYAPTCCKTLNVRSHRLYSTFYGQTSQNPNILASNAYKSYGTLRCCI